jgi:type II secretory pathway pseudopilin PulG
LGFSLVELMVAVGVFMVVGGAAVGVIKSHMPLFNRQQNQAALTTAMRNGAAQMQLDVVNAGAGYYSGIDVASWPVGITLTNQIPPAGTSCFDPANFAYGPQCFDTLNIITTDPTVGPTNPSDATGLKCIDTSTASDIFLSIPGVPAPTSTQLKALAGSYHTNDQILIVDANGKMTTAVLTSDADIQDPFVRLRAGATAADGSNPLPPLGGANPNDPLKITAVPNGNFATSFCPGQPSQAVSWVLKLAPVTYSVDATDPADPKLIRSQGGQNNVLADQVIGFKVGVMLRSNPDTNAYTFDSTSYGSDWTQIMAVRVSMIGRTNRSDVSENFRNAFDGGPYKIEAVSVVINPRNFNTLN